MFPSHIRKHLQKQYKLGMSSKACGKLRNRVQKGISVVYGETFENKSVRLARVIHKDKITWVGFVVENDKVFGVLKPKGLEQYKDAMAEFDEKHAPTKPVKDEHVSHAFKHTKKRLTQRFHLELTKTEYTALCEKLSHPSFWDKFGIKQLKGNLIGLWFKNKWVVFAWDAVKKIIRTAYPAHSNNAFGKKWFENSQKAPLLYRLFTPNFSIV